MSSASSGVYNLERRERESEWGGQVEMLREKPDSSQAPLTYLVEDTEDASHNFVARVRGGREMRARWTHAAERDAEE